ncbi:MAG: hypothetical protein Phog2KO_07420 [Phototrophicaceae bacterium]
MQDIPNASTLMQHLQFTQDDLHANREGQLGENQRIRLQGLQNRAILIGVIGFFAFALIATIFLFFGSENNFFIMTLIGIFVTICNALFVGMFARQYMRLRADLFDNEVEVIEGELERVIIPNGRMNNFLIRLNEEEFYVKKDLFKLFRHEVNYRFYRASHSRVLLSAEPNP